MSELRRNRGPDSGDQPEKIAKVDDPQRRPSLEIRTSDQIEGREIDRREVTPAQRDFIRAERQATASGVPRKPLTTYSMDWESGDHVDGWYDPPPRDDDHDAPSPSDEDDDRGNLDHVPPGNTPTVRDSPYAEPPPDFHRDNAELQARTLERTDAAPADNYGEIAKRKNPDRRRRSDFLKNGEELTKDAGNGAHTVQDLLNYRPPQGHAETRVPKDPNIVSDHAPPPSVADVAASAVAAGLVLGSAGHKIYETIKERKQRRAGNE